jgi:hypothetical protein
MGEGSRFVDCYEHALGVSRDFQESGAPTVCEHRAVLTESGIIFMLLTGIIADGLISEDKLQSIDFLVTCGARGVYDVCTLLCKGIVRFTPISLEFDPHALLRNLEEFVKWRMPRSLAAETLTYRCRR